MPRVVSDVVDVYLFRKVNARMQFLLLLRRGDATFGHTWHPIHARVESGERAVAAAARAVREATGLIVTDAYSADFINPIYDHTRDTVVLAPVLAFAAPVGARLELSADYGDSAWCEREEATARLMWSGQRWAVRHIDEVIGLGGPDAEFYRVQ